MIFVFGDCELDLDRFELRRGGRPRPVEPQVFDLLVTNLAPKLTVPTLIMCSRREPDNRFEQSRLLAALIPKGHLVPLDSSNHLLPERDPAWRHFLAEIDRFLPGSH